MKIAENRLADQGKLDLEPGAQLKKRKTADRRANDLDGRQWLRNSVSIWDDIRKTPEEVARQHPAIFPVQLAARLIETFTNSQQRVILDPFVGSGTTVVAAERLGKIGIGIDRSPDFIRQAKRHPPPHAELFPGVNQPGERRFYAADANILLEYVEPNSVDCVVTSPPYWNILLQERSADEKEIRNYGTATTDLGRITDYTEFIEALGKVFQQVRTALKPGGYCCVVVMDLRKGSRFFPFHSDLAVKMQEVGFIYDDLIIWDRKHEYNNLKPLAHPSVFRINKVHEFILIFQKPQS